MTQSSGPNLLQNLGFLGNGSKLGDPDVKFSNPRSLNSGSSGGSSSSSGKGGYRHQPRVTEADAAHKIKEAFAILIQGVEMTHYDAKSLVGDKKSKKVVWLVRSILHSPFSILPQRPCFYPPPLFCQKNVFPR